MTARADPRALRRLWALREDVAVESDGEAVTLLAPWGEVALGARGRRLEQALRHLALGPVDLTNLAAEERADLDGLLQDVSGAVVHSLELAGRDRASLTVVPIAAPAPFEPRPVEPTDVARLSRLAVVRPWAGRLVVSAPGARHETVCEGPALGALLMRFAAGRQVSDLSGRSENEDADRTPHLDGATPSDVEDIISWFVATGVAVIRRGDGTYPDDDPALAGWSPHELEFDARTRHPGPAVEERFRVREGKELAPVTRAPYPGRVIDLPGATEAPPADGALMVDDRVPPSSTERLSTERLGALLFHGARVRAHRGPGASAHGQPTTRRPYLSMEWLYGLEIYLALDHTELDRGVYHYAPDRHVLTRISLPGDVVREAVTACGSLARPADSPPAAVMLTMCRRARSDRVLGSNTHAAGITEAGALQQSLHLVGRECGITVHPLPLAATEGWHGLIDEVWPEEVPVGLSALSFTNAR